jgi:multiple sugar transport system substrate-binding protein
VKHPDAAWGEFAEAARAPATVDGSVIGIPAVVGNLALLYNKDLVAKAGIPQPTNDMTWDQFGQVAKTLTDRAHNIYGTAYDVTGGEGTTWAMWPQLWQNGGEILSKKPRPTVEGYVGLSRAFGETVSKILQVQVETKPRPRHRKTEADKSLADE